MYTVLSTIAIEMTERIDRESTIPVSTSARDRSQDKRLTLQRRVASTASRQCNNWLAGCEVLQ